MAPDGSSALRLEPETRELVRVVAMGSVDGKTVDLAALARDLEADYEPMLASTNEAVKYADLIPAIMRT